jgi:hypothetical protein
MRFLNTAAVAALAAALLAGPVFAADTASPSGSTAAAPAKSRVSKDITRQAYLDLAGKRFDAMDANHDGTLTVAERQAAHHGMRHARGAAPSVAPSAPSTSPAPSTK